MNYSNLQYKLLSAPLLIYLFSFPVSFVQSGVVRTKSTRKRRGMPWLGICASDLVLALTALASTGVAAFLAPTPPPLASTRGPMSRFRMEPMSRFRVQAVTHTTRRNAPCALTCRAAVKSPTDVALEAWADRVGIQRSVEIGRGSFGRGLFATQDLAAGDAAVRVPLTLALNDQITPLRGREGATMPEPVADLHYTARLAAALAHEMSLGAQSALSHYIAALPEPPRTLHKWEASSLRQLQNNTLEAEADGVYFWRYNNWDAVQDALDAIPGIDRASIDGWLGYDAFMQALDYVCSRTLRVAETAPSNLLSFPKLPLRSFSESAEDASKGQFQKYTALEKGGGGVMRVMVPFLDLANHAPAPTGGYFDLDPEGTSIPVHNVHLSRMLTLCGCMQPTCAFLPPLLSRPERRCVCVVKCARLRRARCCRVIV